MNEQDNVRLLEEAYRSWNDNKEGSFENWMNMIADDVKWGSLADGAAGMEFTQACCSKTDVARYFETLAEEWKMISYQADEFIAQGDRVVMVGRCKWIHRKTGKTVDTPKADVLRMKDGKIVEFFEFYDTAGALAATR